jgi:hypothetical protein
LETLQTILPLGLGRLHQELRRKGMTLMLQCEEHRADYADVHTYGDQ